MPIAHLKSSTTCCRVVTHWLRNVDLVYVEINDRNLKIVEKLK